MGIDLYSWVLIPFLIFLARVVDVSLGTLRIIFLAKGYRKLAPMLGFFEVLVWLLAVREVMVNLRNVLCVIAYGAGFAMGNYVGMWIEERLSIGMVLLRVVFKQSPAEFITYMRENNYGFTVVEGEGTREKVKIFFSVIKRKHLPEVLAKLSTTNPNAFYSIEDIKSVNEGLFPFVEGSPVKILFSKQRKSK